MSEYHTSKSEWTVLFFTGKSIAFMHKLKDYKEEWMDQYLDGDRDDPNDEDSDWGATIGVHSTRELHDLLAMLREDNAREVSIQVSFADLAFGLKCWSCLDDFGGEIATIQIEDRDVTRSARIENTAKQCIASLNKAILPPFPLDSRQR